MNERLTIQDLTDLLAAKHSMTKKDAEAFVKEFFLLIEQALENEKTVKIKGLGTFKLVDVDSRESVNVNTGERFQIKGHTKVSFTPDTNLRDTINKPFAHFETVVLNEGTVLEDTPMEESDEEEGAVSDTETEMIDSEIAGNEYRMCHIQMGKPTFSQAKFSKYAIIKFYTFDNCFFVPAITSKYNIRIFILAKCWFLCNVFCIYLIIQLLIFKILLHNSFSLASAYIRKNFSLSMLLTAL